MRLPVVFATTVFDQPDHGPAVYARYLWEALRTSDEFDFHIVAPTIDMDDPKLHAAGKSANSRLLYRQVAQKTLEVARNLGPRTIIHANNTHPFGPFRSYGGPWLVQVNDYEVARLWRDVASNLPKYKWRRLASLAWRHHQERHVVQAAKRVVCNSDCTRSEILSAYPRIRTDRVITIHKGVDCAVFKRPRDIGPIRAPNATPVYQLVFVGSNWQLKGLPELLAAMGHVIKRLPNTELLLVGPSNSEASVKQLVTRYNLEANVCILGRVSRTDLASTFWESDILVMPSRVEAFGVAAVEAMAAGLPVIATRVGGLCEIIRSPNEGVLVTPGSVHELSEAIVALLLNVDRRRTIAAAGLSRAQDFSIGTVIEKLKNVYLNLSS